MTDKLVDFLQILHNDKHLSNSLKMHKLVDNLQAHHIVKNQSSSLQMYEIISIQLTVQMIDR